MYLHRHLAGRDGSQFDWQAFLVITMAGSLISMVITGFLFPTNTNIFHLPIVARLFDEPQYAQDAFIQSLRYYSSGIWLILEGSTSWAEPNLLFFIMAYVSHFLFLAGLVACATLLGVRGRKERLLLVALLCATHLLRYASYAGGDDLFSNYFTHSEIANGLFLIGLYLMMRRRIAAGVALIGLIFFVNAFKGVWAAPVFAAILLAQISSGEISWRQGIGRAAIGACGAVLFAAPVIAAVLGNPELGEPQTFDYTNYLYEYFPHHFIFSSNPVKERIALAVIAALGACSLLLLGRCARLLVVALAAVCAIYAIGAIASSFSHSQLLFNLHLLRIGGFIHSLAALAVSTLATVWFFGNEPAKSVLASAMVAAISVPSLVSAGIISALAIVLYALWDKDLDLLERYAPPQLRNIAPFLAATSIVWMSCVMVFVYHRLDTENALERQWIGEWRQIAGWAHDNTSSYSIFLVPPGNVTDQNTPENLAASSDSIFEFVSHRRIWVDFKRGAAVMWMPPYYHVWHRRIAEVSSLATHQERLRYAHREGIDYLVEICGPGDRKADVIFASRQLCVYPASAALESASSAKIN
jgi:hypothetical protein